MHKMCALLLLMACLLVRTQLTVAEYEEESQESEERSNSKQYSVMGNPLASRRFVITLTSAKSFIASGASAFSAMGWFMNTLKHIKKIPNNQNLKAPTITDTLFKLKMIELKLNRNYDNAVDFKNSVTETVPDAETDILISKKGFYCDDNFCEQAGDSQYGMGICTPYYCDCSQDVPESRRCDKLYEAFDPVYRYCGEAYRVKICGF